jgi:hypothetical protein
MLSFRSENCYADVEAFRHDRVIKCYLDDVILPALVLSSVA